MPTKSSLRPIAWRGAPSSVPFARGLYGISPGDSLPLGGTSAATCARAVSRVTPSVLNARPAGPPSSAISPSSRCSVPM